jgi:ABC-2 type transport system permease protein
MQVYNAYFKIIRKRLPSILIYVVVFIVVAIIITSVIYNGGSYSGGFVGTKSKVALFDGDNTALSRGLGGYIAENAQIIQIPDNKQDIEDALFYEQVAYVLRIPKGFTESFLSGGSAVSLEKTTRAGTASTVYTDFLIDRYLNMAGLYVQNSPGITEAGIVENVAKDLKNEAVVEVKDYQKPSAVNLIAYYFRYLAYSILAVMIMGVTSFMMAFNERDLNNRNLSSPLKPVSMNLQIALGNVTYALVVWALLLVSVFALYGNAGLNAGILLLCLNSLIFTMVALSIGFLCGKFIRSAGAQSAIANVISLGLSFLSGVFVEQSLLGKTVLDIASFTPVYWYVKAVDGIQQTVDFTAANVAPIVNSMLIQAGFAVAILIVALVVTKQKRASAA